MPEVTQLVSGGSRKREYGWSCEMTSGHMWKQAPLRALLFLFAFFFFCILSPSPQRESPVEGFIDQRDIYIL